MDEIEESRSYERLSFRFFTRQDLLLKAPILHQIFQDALFNTLELLGSVIVPVISDLSDRFYYKQAAPSFFPPFTSWLSELMCFGLYVGLGYMLLSYPAYCIHFRSASGSLLQSLL